MPPEDVASVVRIRKVRSFIDFAATLQSQLSGPLDAGDVELLISDTGHHIQQIHNATQPGSSGQEEERSANRSCSGGGSIEAPALHSRMCLIQDAIVRIGRGGSIEAPDAIIRLDLGNVGVLRQDTLEKRIDGAINQLSILNIVSICAVWLRERIRRNSSSGASLPDVKESPVSS